MLLSSLRRTSVNNQTTINCNTDSIIFSKRQVFQRRITVMQDKLKLLSNSMLKQIRDQAEHANELDIETKKLKMELSRQKDEVK